MKLNEAFVSYENAVLLKKIGFFQDDWHGIHKFYTPDGELVDYNEGMKTLQNIKGYENVVIHRGNADFYKHLSDVQAPTQELAMKFLRERYGIMICSTFHPSKGLFSYGVQRPFGYDNPFEEWTRHNTYEEAMEAAITYVCNKIIKEGIK